MIAELIPKVVEMEQAEKGESIYYPRPSLAGPSRCARQMVYWGTGAKKQPLPGRAVMVMEDSSLHEIMTIDRINKTAVKHHSSQLEVDCLDLGFTPEKARTFCSMCKKNISPSVLHGHIDGIITDLAGHDYLWEHKALSHFTWQAMEDGKMLPYDYITQCCLYYYGLLNLVKLDGIILTIKNKNTSGLMDICMQYDTGKDMVSIEKIVDHTGLARTPADDYLLQESIPTMGVDWLTKHKSPKQPWAISGVVTSAIEKFKHVNDCIHTRTLPLRQYEMVDWQCQYCPFGGLCWEGWDEEIRKRADVNAKTHKFSEDFITTLGFYQEQQMHLIELRKQIKEHEAQKGELKKDINIYMETEKIKTADTGKYYVSLDIKERKGFVVEPKTYKQLTVKTVEKKNDSNSSGA